MLTAEEYVSRIKQSLVGKPKWIYQVIWERVSFDHNSLKQYTKEDKFGILQPHTCLNYIHPLILKGV
jgi:hypothetical protein